jgi:hypothetical protein
LLIATFKKEYPPYKIGDELEVYIQVKYELTKRTTCILLDKTTKQLVTVTSDYVDISERQGRRFTFSGTWMTT